MKARSTAACLLWFRQDLRLADNPALCAAAEAGLAVIPVFIWSPEEEGRRPPGAAGRYWLHQSLAALDAELRKRRARLILRRGSTAAELGRLLAETRACAIYWNRRYEPEAVKQAARLRRELAAENVELRDYAGSLLCEPHAVRTKAGTPFKVFTPFYRAALQQYRHEPVPPSAPPMESPAHWPRSLNLDALDLLPRVDWAGGIRRFWRCGERAAQERLAQFVDEQVDDYDRLHDRPDRDGTSCLSPHFHFGEISPQQAWDAVIRAAERRAASPAAPRSAARKNPWPAGAEAFLRQLFWREFSCHVLAHFPRLPDQPLHPQFARLPWKRSGRELKAWQSGRTGYPVIDAAMRQLWETGWMHNRARMIVGSFLVKDLLIRWQEGERWFWDTLVDADLACNAFNWQWTAGCGADPAPFFRIFNPVLQGQKFDPQGDYVRRYVPELARMPARYIHAPWAAPEGILKEAGVDLGRTYPQPMVDHAEARDRALLALASVKGVG
ncbi:MAG: deoxyribodipyrimidine photo-lyase [Candidatus Eisenbacteria bacterium]